MTSSDSVPAAGVAARVRHFAGRLPTPSRRTVGWGIVLCNVEALYVVSYASIVGRPLLDPFLIAPWVWINVAIWAILRTDPPAASTRRRLAGGLIGAAYVVALAVLANSLGPGAALGGNPATGLGYKIFEIPPGWAPTLYYNGAYVHVSVVPAYALGFLALGYLLYAAVLETTSAAGLGVFGASVGCVSCTLPLFVGLLAGATGASTVALLDVLTDYRYVIGPALFVATVALLFWRPGFGASCRAD